MTAFFLSPISTRLYCNCRRRNLALTAWIVAGLLWYQSKMDLSWKPPIALQSTGVGESGWSPREEFCWHERSNCQLRKNPGDECKCYQTLNIPRLDILISIEDATMEKRFLSMSRLDHLNVVEVASPSKSGLWGSFTSYMLLMDWKCKWYSISRKC